MAGSSNLLAALPALFFDPAASGCHECPANLLLIRDGPQAVEQASRAAGYAGVGWAAMLVGVLVWRLARSSAARRRTAAPVVGPALVYLNAVALDYLRLPCSTPLLLNVGNAEPDHLGVHPSVLLGSDEGRPPTHRAWQPNPPRRPRVVARAG
jgi:hypothetical protein